MEVGRRYTEGMPRCCNKRALVRLLIVASIGGFINLLVANAVGWFSGIDLGSVSVRSRFVGTGQMFAEVRDGHGRGWHVLEWGIKDRQTSADFQYMDDHGNIPMSGPGVDPAYLRCDPPASFPAWARFWDPSKWPADYGSGGMRNHGFADEVAFGWPLISFGLHWETPSRQWQGGTLIRPKPRSARHWLVWQPLLPSALIGSAFWATAVGVVVLTFTFVARALGRKPWQCASCGYDRRGLTSESKCPECGKAPIVPAA